MRNRLRVCRTKFPHVVYAVVPPQPTEFISARSPRTQGARLPRDDEMVQYHPSGDAAATVLRAPKKVYARKMSFLSTAGAIVRLGAGHTFHRAAMICLNSFGGALMRFRYAGTQLVG
jgi:hypothetical protein